MTDTTLTKNQTRTYGPKQFTEAGRRCRITATVRYDDRCGNGHNSFSITGETDEHRNGRWYESSGGCIHDEIARHFPELAPLIKWHLCSTDGPMHYVATTRYHAQAGDLDAARRCAVWPDATDDDLTAPGLEELLMARLPQLLADFRRDVESLGFTW